MSYKLTAELVPAPLWEINLRLLLTQSSWNILKKQTYKNANYLCEICGGKGKKHPVECHEKWHYNDTDNIQTLIGTIALCPMCHQTKHFGRAQLMGYFEDVKNHFVKVNEIPKNEAIEYFNKKMIEFNKRSQYEWQVNLNWLQNHPNLKFKNKYQFLDNRNN